MAQICERETTWAVLCMYAQVINAKMRDDVICNLWHWWFMSARLSLFFLLNTNILAKYTG